MTSKPGATGLSLCLGCGKTSRTPVCRTCRWGPRPSSRKTCGTCGLSRPLSDFTRSRGTPDRLQSRCKSCTSAAYHARVAADPEGVRGARRAHHVKAYGLTPDDYDSLLEKQDGKCAICARPAAEAPGKHGLHIDHCHTTGAVRGLLCANCNRGLGLFADDPSALETAAQYLRRNPLI